MVEVEGHELAFVLNVRRVLVEGFVHELVARQVGRRADRIGGDVARDMEIPQFVLAEMFRELVGYGGGRGEVVEAGHVLERVGVGPVPVDGARGLLEGFLSEVETFGSGAGGTWREVYGAVGIDVRLGVAPARVEHRGVHLVVEVVRGELLPLSPLELLELLPPPLVLDAVDEEEDAGDAGELGGDDAGDVEEEGVAVGVVEGGGVEVGPGAQLAADFGLEDGDVHDEAEQHHQTYGNMSISLRMFSTLSLKRGNSEARFELSPPKIFGNVWFLGVEIE